MEKQQADYVIKQYLKPLYRFASSKTNDSDKADELASRIVLEVYEVLLSKNDILDVNAYIYKVARNVYAKFYHDLKVLQSNADIDGIQIESGEFTDDIFLKNEDYRFLRREIAYLSSLRRKIIMAYYYGSKKIAEIAAANKISEGTVKWHLFECKKELKHGMENIRNIGNLGLNPIKFYNMGHVGIPGTKGDTSYYLAKSISQNVAYSCYYEPHTINEIADELGVSPIFISDEVEELTEYGFMDKLSGNRYQTNIIINTYDKGASKKSNELFTKCGKLLVEAYFSKIIDKRNEIEALPFYYTDNDFNFLLWSLIMYCTSKLDFPELNSINFDDIAVHRPDGGHYIATSHLYTPNTEDIFPEPDWYYFTGYMRRSDKNFDALKLLVSWCNEDFGWEKNRVEDYKLLYHFIKGELPQNERNLDSYELLISKGYLIQTEDGYKANIVYIPNKKIKEKLDHLLSIPDKELLETAKKLNEEILQYQILGHPKHMHKAIKYMYQNCLKQEIHVYAMKYMLDCGMLKLPTKEQEKQICNILMSREERE